MSEIIEELRKTLPPVFAVTSLDEMTGGLINHRTIQNKKSLGEIPEDCFFYTGRRLGVRRDPFLVWFATTLSGSFCRKAA